MKKIKVFRIGSIPSLLKPGMGIACSKLANHKNFETTLATYKPGINDELTPILSDNANVQIIPFFNPTMPKNRKGLYFFLKQIQRLIAIINFALIFLIKNFFIKPDIVHIHTPMHFLIAYWGRLRRAKVILTVHGTDFQRIRESILIRTILYPIQNIYCVSRNHADIFSKLFPNKNVQTVYNGVDFDEFKIQEFKNNTKNKIISIGTLRWHKDFSTLIKSFALISEEFPSWTLEIYGDGPDRSDLQKLIHSKGLESKAFLKGSVSREEISCRLNESKIFALSSVTEAIPKVLLEAMASKCACVVTDVGDCSYVIQDAGIVTNSGDVKLFANRLQSLMKDDILMKNISEKAHKRVQTFSWKTYCELHEKLYFNIINNN